MHGQFVWYELTTPDVDAAKKFYPRFTKWGTQAFDNDYTMWTAGGVPRAGIFRLNDDMRKQGVPPNWMPYIESDDVDATAKKAASLGGTVVVPPADIPGTGRFAVLKDPQGATFGVYKSVRPSNAWDGKPEMDRFSWHELMTTDYPKAFDFYRALFNWGKNGEMDMGEGLMYLMFGHGASMYGGIYNRMPDMANVPPFWLVYIHVKDVGKAVDAAVKAGATIVRPRMDIPGGTIAILADPQGAGFALHDLNSMPAAATPVAEKIASAGASVKTSVGKAVKAVKKAATSDKADAVKAKLKSAATAVRKVAKKAASKTSKMASGIRAKVTRTSPAKPKAKAKSRAKARPSAAKPRAAAKPKTKARTAKVVRKSPARSRSSARTAKKSSRRPASKK